MKALLALEDERTFACRSFTGAGEISGEVVFNTSMTGYQEILTDPSYKGQLVTMTYPLIGNYGVNKEDPESDRIQASALIVREYQEFPSNFRSVMSLADYLTKAGVLGVDELDTRALTRHIRKKGAMRAAISSIDLNPASLAEKARKIPAMTGCDLVRDVSTHMPYFWKNGQAVPLSDTFLHPLNTDIWQSTPPGPACSFSVVAFDFGIKKNILRYLEGKNCDILVVPAETSATTIRALQPDGIFLSNGPGDPESVTYAVETIRELLGYRPMFGICLGHQLLALALGGKTHKLKFGHRGSNQPVRYLPTGHVEITSQNHGFVVDPESLDIREIEITHINLNENSLEGFRHRTYPIIAVQYHPEAAPGPHDAAYLFDEFITMMKQR
jgi:carbamoyl-phosphate synthase small subunit